MYEKFFGLSERPFAVPPLAKRYFAATAIDLARQTLARVVQRAEGIGLLTGPAGTGKTLLCQVLAEQFQSRLEVVLLASGRFNTRRSLLQAILFELGLPYREMEEGDLRLSLIDHLTPRADNSNGNGLLLIVDEAHSLPLRLMEELRLITNFVRNGQPRVRLVLSGAPLLEERFASPKMASFNQRVAARCYLESLDKAQTIGYVRSQIEQVHGAADAIFSSDALDAIYHATDGIPRLVNQLCDHALLLALAGGKRSLTAAGIEEAWADLQQLPTPWNAAQGAPAIERNAGVVEFGSLDDGTAEDLPSALPFRAANSESTRNEITPLERLTQITAQLAKIDGEEERDLDDEFQPAGSIGPELELVFQSAASPFHHAFDEEEVVLDRYTAMEVDALANRPLVRTAESRQLGAMLPSPAPAPKPSVGISAATWPGGAELPKSVKSAARPVMHPIEVPQFDAASQSPTKSEIAAVALNSQQASPMESIAASPPAIEAVFQQHSPTPQGAQDEHDLIVIEEPDVVLPVTIKAPVPVRRKEYRQLFAQLRRG
jgi:type II secretory pathway predicted ATPase ExeA